ncbi:increased rDNA silencing protein 4 [Lasiosphaeria hispida]|uniref:Increased rDNA silencing protein 4 n=1 Tax=Lasiosphaeria hispida TaxID=260671 RepID=A0AAJ0HLL3_9PEZI|nr:increased rDNA silencing protein 4 [Lasiosphaeria hispida]
MQAPGAATQGRGATAPSTPGNAAAAAALKGATLAFQSQQNKAAANDHRPAPVSSNSPPTTANPTNPPSNSGARRAATQAARERDRPWSPTGPAQSGNISRQGTGGSHHNRSQLAREDEHGAVMQRLSAPSQSHSRSRSGSGSGNARPDPARASASLIAAALAASRSASPSPMPSPMGMSATQLHSRVTRRPSEGSADTESIRPTGSLISMFEGRREAEDVDPVKREGVSKSPARGEGVGEGRPRLVKEKPRPKPKPNPAVVVRAATIELEEGADEVIRAGSRLSSRPRMGEGLGSEDRRELSSELDAGSRTVGQARSQGKPPVAARKPKPVPRTDPGAGGGPVTPQPPPRSATELVSPKSIKLDKTPRLDPPRLPARSSATRSEADMTKYDRRASATRPLSGSSASSDDSFVSASSTQSPRAVSPVKDLELPSTSYGGPNQTSSRQPSPKATSPTRSTFHPNSSPTLRSAARRPTAPAPAPGSPTSSLALDSLTNAIVAGNIASSRLVTKPSTNPPPLPAPRRHNHRPRSPQHGHHTLQPQRTAESPHHTGGSNKSASAQQPRTGMLQTLRAPHSSLSDDEDARHRMHRHRKKHALPTGLGGGNKKHAHSEGSRRRWRDAVSARERRRYEAVWASNRGLFLEGSTAEAEMVVNVVVRDIWGRSRLPADELSEVWELVDRRGEGVLDRQEFVVGMWLIDQRLRGRKIPARVGESVWESVRGGGVGVVVPGPKGRRR